MPLDILITCALPASGKSETRKFLANLTPAEQEALLLGNTETQVDDYPYVHIMRTIDVCLKATGHDYIFFGAPHLPFRCPWLWLVLIELVNEDYHDIVVRTPAPTGVAPLAWLFGRFARAAKLYPACTVNFEDADVIGALAGSEAEEEAATLLREKFAGIPESLEGRTVIMEFARGGPEGAEFPLPAPLGYQASLAGLSDEILSRAAIMYIWVTPEQSYAKNIARGQEASNTVSTQLSLNHSVPHEVMKGDYGTDDFMYLVGLSDRPGFVRVTSATGTTHYVPVAVLDNREDLTSSFRQPPAAWDPAKVAAMKAAVFKCFETLVQAKK